MSTSLVLGQQAHYLDTFSTVSYSNNDGTQNWSSDWIENDPFGNAGPVGDFVGIVSNNLLFYWSFANAEWIKRSADLTGATSVTLTFDWQTVSLDNNESLRVQVSSDGVNFVTIGSLIGNTNGIFSQDISAYISATTTIRFINDQTNWENDDGVFIDNVMLYSYDTSIPFDQPLSLVEQFNGYTDYVSTGNTLRADSNAVNTCTIVALSSNTLTSPMTAGATIEKAYLYWSHSGLTPDSQVTFEGQTVNADKSYGSAIIPSRIFYNFVSDVTSIVNGVANPSTNIYDFSDLTIDNSDPFYCFSNITLGGWSLIIFYSDPILPAASINLYEGFAAEQNSASSYPLSGFYANNVTGAKATFLSWEGDQDILGSEQLSVTNQALTTTILSGDGGQIGDNPFNSTIYDDTVVPVINTTTTYGLDLDTYDISSYIATGDNTITANLQSGGDFIIPNAVIIKVPSNLISGTVFEDVNYGGGVGRDLVTSSGIPVENVTVELYDNSSVLVETTTTDGNGDYFFGGMASGTYSVRVVNSSVQSTRAGGLACATCMPVQTFKRNFASSIFSDITNEVGGANPSGQDVVVGTLTNAQSISTVTIGNEGVVGLDFGYNFNTIVNTNDAGQGSLRQFIINSNNLTGNGLLAQQGLTASRENSIFMIPSSTDPLGRTADLNFSSGVATITLSSSLTTITDDDTHIDGTTQTINIGDTNAGSVGTGGIVGIDAEPLPTYLLPEIVINGSGNTTITIDGDASNIVIGNLVIYNSITAVSASANGGTGINRIVREMLLGVLSDGSDPGAALRNTRYGVELQSAAELTVTTSYIGWNGRGGILGTSSTSVLNATYNEVFQNGWNSNSHDGVDIDGINSTIQYNLVYQQQTNTGLPSIGGGNGIELGSKAVGVGNNLIDNNTVFNNVSAGINIRKGPSNNTVSKNIIYENEVGIAVNDEGRLPTNGNLFTQNSTYDNSGLGIDLFGGGAGNFDGITLNDLNDLDTGSNDLVNFPIFESITVYGTNLRVKGWARPGAIIELFKTDISEGTASTGDNQLGLTQDYGEGQIYLTTITEGSGADLSSSASLYNDPDGNNDNTNEFDFIIPIPSGVVDGTIFTATTTISNSTSEFSPAFTLDTNADLSLRKTVDNSSPNQGDNITFTLTVSNAGPSAPTSILVSDIIPIDFTYTHIPSNYSTTQGTVTFNTGTRVLEWDAGALFALAVNNTITLTYTVTVDVCGEFNNQAEIINSSLIDPDSTPNNGG